MLDKGTKRVLSEVGNLNSVDFFSRAVFKAYF